MRETTIPLSAPAAPVTPPPALEATIALYPEERSQNIGGQPRIVSLTIRTNGEHRLSMPLAPAAAIALSKALLQYAQECMR